MKQYLIIAFRPSDFLHEFCHYIVAYFLASSVSFSTPFTDVAYTINPEWDYFDFNQKTTDVYDIHGDESDLGRFQVHADFKNDVRFSTTRKLVFCMAPTLLLLPIVIYLLSIFYAGIILSIITMYVTVAAIPSIDDIRNTLFYIGF